MSKVKNSSFELVISHIGAGGDGVGEYNNRPVYVPKTAPGDVARVGVRHERTDGIDADLIEIITPSPDRVDAPSPYYDQCGGCALQHVQTDFYRAWKIEKVKTTLQKAGVAPEGWEDPVFLPAATRRRTTLAALRQGHNLRLGYHAPRSHTITDVQSCAILTPEVDRLAQQMRPFLLRILPDKSAISIFIQRADHAYDVVFNGVLAGKAGLSLAQHEALGEMLNEMDIARVSVRRQEFGKAEILLQKGDVIKTFGSISVALPPGAFLQASAQSEKILSDFVVEKSQGARRVADLFAGCGTFSGALLSAPDTEVHSFENDVAAIAALSNAARNYKNLRVTRRDLFKSPLTPAELSAFDTVVFDPPRAGAKEQCLSLAQSTVPRLVAISCNPASFARDAKILQQGGYVLKSVRIIDQFVWSSHVEIAAVFTRP